MIESLSIISRDPHQIGDNLVLRALKRLSLTFDYDDDFTRVHYYTDDDDDADFPMII